MGITRKHFRWNGCFWIARVLLRSWRGFQSRGGPYGAQDSDEASDGVFEVTFAPEGRGDAPLTDDEIALVQWFIDHEAEVSGALTASLLEKAPEMKREFDEAARELLGTTMPVLSSLDDLRNHTGLHGVFVHQVSVHGTPYVGFEFGCSWDDEHGLGVLMHGNRLVEAGGADHAMLLWMVEADAKKQDRIQVRT